MPGVKGRSGRKPESKHLAFTQLIDNCWTPEQRTAVLNQLIKDCQSKDFHERSESRKLLFAYTFGKPKETVEHSNPDGSPLLQPVADALTKVYGSS